MASPSETREEFSRCQTCYKPLYGFPLGFDICPMCLYHSRVKAASRPHMKAPSYRSPLLALDQETDGTE